MATLTTQSVVNAGLAEAMVAAAVGGDLMTPGPTNYLRVANGGGSSITVTIARVQPCSDGSVAQHDISVAVPAASVRDIKVDQRYGRLTDGMTVITYSGVTTVTVGAFSVA